MPRSELEPQRGHDPAAGAVVAADQLVGVLDPRDLGVGVVVAVQQVHAVQAQAEVVVDLEVEAGVERVVVVLENVRSFHLNKLHLVSLDPEVKSGFEPNVTDSVLVSLSWLHGEEWHVWSSDFTGFSVDENTVGGSKGATTVEEGLESGVALGVPVVDEDGVVIFGVSVRDGDEETAVDTEATETTGETVESG